MNWLTELYLFGRVSLVLDMRNTGVHWGHLDLVGNLQKWLLDYFASYINPCTDCANLAASGSGRAPRDGNFTDKNETLLLAPYRNNGFYPENSFYTFGFRCARTP